MRYTLRLLTLQQFQRATTLICAMEVLRRDKPLVWGNEPFTIGLWVGQKVTPNKTQEAHDVLDALRNNRKPRTGAGSPAQLTSCPWCGSEIAPGRDIHADKDQTRTTVSCGDKRGACDFSKRKSDIGLPIIVVDEELYRRPPSMLIATVDKFAMMAWRGEVKNLFGIAERECDRHGLDWPDSDCATGHKKKGKLPAATVKTINPIRPPDLIIQDDWAQWWDSMKLLLMNSQRGKLVKSQSNLKSSHQLQQCVRPAIRYGVYFLDRYRYFRRMA